MEDPSIIRLNIERFNKLLRGPLDPDTRLIVEQLLAEAQAALRAWGATSGPKQGC